MNLRSHEDLIVFVICLCAIVGSWMDVVPGWVVVPLIMAGALRRIQKGGGVETIRKGLRK